MNMQINEPLERRSFARVDLVVMFVLGCVCFGFATSAVGYARFNARGQACLSNLKHIVIASISYGYRMEKLPGYSNMLVTTEGKAYVDPRTGKMTPVSWAVALFYDLDRGPVYQQMRQPPQNGERTDYLETPIDVLLCPDDPREKVSPLLSYVANSGRQDSPAATAASAAPTPRVGMPRDWQANGVFFDNYSDDPLVKTEAATRGPMVVMRSGQIRDPKDKTILFTENLDAGSYVFDPKTVPNADPANAEIGWGCIWGAGAVDAKAMPPTMTPDAPASAINAKLDVASRKPGYEYCRPSSSHVGGVNVAFAAGNVVFLNDKINYFVFAKLMASDDAGIKTPGTQTLADPALRLYQLSDDELKP